MLRRYFIISLSFMGFTSSANLLAQEQGRETLASGINSPYIEMRPLISPDGQSLFFGRKEHPENIKGEKDLLDLYVVQKENGRWGKARNLGGPVNNKYGNSLGSVSPDGGELLMINTYKYLDGPLARFVKKGNSWSQPQPVVIDDFQNDSQYFDFYQSYQENVLLIAIERDGGRGEQDIYVCFKKKDGTWTKPKNLGPGVNTLKSDFAPFLAEDGRTLFFASYGLAGKGGADLYYTQRLDNTWTKWSKPVNLGAPINTSGEETYCSVTADGKSLYYVSYRMDSDIRDIYETSLLPVFQLQDTAADNTILALGSNSNSAQKLVASTELSAAVPLQHDNLVSTAEAETLPVSSSAMAEPEHERKNLEEFYNNERAEILVEEAADTAGPLKLVLLHKAVASDIPGMLQYSVLKKIYFGFNQTAASNSSYQDMLLKLKDYVMANPGTVLKIVGHADDRGTKAENQLISQLRAKFIKKQLLNAGIPAERVLVHFRGESEPLASNDDELEGRELNRRAEIFILLPESSFQ